MHEDMTRGRPLTCSNCGSTNALKPLNSRAIEVQCGQCGHIKLTREAEDRDGGDFVKMWQPGPSDKAPTF